jgi:hypothetical protein
MLWKTKYQASQDPNPVGLFFEIQASKGHDDYGSTWRQNDLDVVSGKEFKELLKDNNIILTGWKQICDLMNK